MWEKPEKKECNRCHEVLPIEAFSVKTYKSKSTGESYYRVRSQCKECERKNASEWSDKNHAEILQRRKQKRLQDKTDLSPILHYLRKHKWDWPLLDETYLLHLYNEQSGLCYYTKQVLQFHQNGLNWDGISLDRLDPKQGYIPGNVAFCSYRVNTMKGNLTESEFYQMLQDILDLKHGPLITPACNPATSENHS